MPFLRYGLNGLFLIVRPMVLGHSPYHGECLAVLNIYDIMFAHVVYSDTEKTCTYSISSSGSTGGRVCSLQLPCFVDEND